MTSVTERFEDKFVPEPNSGCWIWVGAAHRNGRGRFWYNGKITTAHRVSFELYKGTIPDSLFVCHTCDNPSCVNPNHLYAGTAKDNQQDVVKRKRHPNMKKSFCKRGHPLEGDNLLANKNGIRQCKTCHRERQLRYYREKVGKPLD